MTLSRRLLIHVVIGAAIATAVVSYVTYRIVYQAAEQRALEHLNTYVSERTKREEANFRTIYSNLEVVRSLFLQRLSEPPPADLEARWNERFELYPDGAWRNREKYFAPRKYSDLWLHKDVKLTPEFKTRVLRAQEVCEDVQGGWVDTFQSVYFVLPGPATMGFDPRIARWAWQTPADYDLDAEEWVKIARPDRNPSRNFVWTGVFVDAPTSQPFVTVQLPVDVDGQQIATVAHDTHINQLFDEIAKSEFQGATHLIFRPDGRLIAHPQFRSQILSSNGALTCADSGDPALASLYRLCVAKAERQFSGTEPVSGAYFSASRLPAAEWYFVTLMPNSLVRAQAVRSAQWVWLSGGALLALFFISFAGILRRQVTRPLAALTTATREMAAGKMAEETIPGPAQAQAQADELRILAESFREMVARVLAREGDLRQLNASLEQRVVERTAELERALAQQTELAKLKTDFVSLVSHEFRTPLGVIMSAADVLRRYFGRLAEEKRERHLEMIFRSTRNLSSLIEEVMLLGRVEEGRMPFEPLPVDMEKLCASIADELRSATGGACPIRYRALNSLDGAVSDEKLLRHVLCNLLSNAVKYSEPGSPVDFTVARRGDRLEIVVCDRGIGIPPADQARLFTSFTRASNVGHRPGTGLGLVIVQRCVQKHGGEITLESVVGVGTTVTILLPVFSAATSPAPAVCATAA